MPDELTFVTIGPVLRALDVAGLSVFAVSGALAAARQRPDIVATCVFALVTATGGGTMRDVLIGAPVCWIGDPAPRRASRSATRRSAGGWRCRVTPADRARTSRPRAPLFRHLAEDASR